MNVYTEWPGNIVHNWWLSGKESACNAADSGSIPGSGRSPGEGNGNPLQYSCLENPMDRGAWQVIVHGVAKSQTWLSNWTTIPCLDSQASPGQIHATSARVSLAEANPVTEPLWMGQWEHSSYGKGGRSLSHRAENMYSQPTEERSETFRMILNLTTEARISFQLVKTTCH